MRLLGGYPHSFLPPIVPFQGTPLPLRQRIEVQELPREVGELRRFISRLIEYHRIELNKKVNFFFAF